MADEAIARARAIAARLGNLAAPPEGSELGKRKSRWDSNDGTAPFSMPGLGMTKKKKIYVPVNEHPDINFLGLLIGPRGSTQKMLEEKSGAKILIRGRGSSKDGVQSSHPDDDDDLYVMIEGTQDAVDIAATEVEKILYNPEEAMRLKREQLRNLAEMNGPREGHGRDGHYGPSSSDESSIEMKVPNSMVGLIIGKGGENIQKMQAQCGIHVQIAKESEMRPGETHRTVMLRGSQEGTEEAKRRIEEMIEERMTRGRDRTHRDVRSELSNMPFVLMVPVPNERVGVIIGKNGATVKSIQDLTDTVIKIPPQPDDNDPNTRTVAVGGSTKAATEAALAEIYRVLQSQSQTPQSVAPILYMPIPDEKVGVVIGKNGSTIKDLQTRTHTRIQIPTVPDPGSNPPVRTVSIQGTQEQAFLAKCEIETLLGLPLGGMEPGYGGSGSYGTQQYSYSGYEGGPAGSFVNDPYQSYYGGASQSDPQASQQNAGSNGDPAAATGQPPPPQDPTAYYTEFWKYSAYYGEEAARTAYGAWAPPLGTLPPEDFVLPPPPPPPPSSTSANGAESSNTENGTQQGGADASAGATSADAWAQWQQYYGQTQGQEQVPGAQLEQPAAPGQGGSADGADAEVAARQAWEQYYQQYYQYYGHYPTAEGQQSQGLASTQGSQHGQTGPNV